MLKLLRVLHVLLVLVALVLVPVAIAHVVLPREWCLFSGYYLILLYTSVLLILGGIFTFPIVIGILKKREDMLSALPAEHDRAA
ncbi:hypothetical protein [Candidatus Finniella inopinata]|uniref:Uncharacterized protein n=1 Tax=Candidatus Finniella inopinata TaxID=1696036 RepID=A0A4Q7DGF5_9PROT|nr:hypothetical protein [Candidatus Finniella inopinata]RZI45268.1 hypothetical protein EQU50_07710 [Candidatus Finniella inopinata]